MQLSRNVTADDGREDRKNVFCTLLDSSLHHTINGLERDFHSVPVRLELCLANVDVSKTFVDARTFARRRPARRDRLCDNNLVRSDWLVCHRLYKTNKKRATELQILQSASLGQHEARFLKAMNVYFSSHVYDVPEPPVSLRRGEFTVDNKHFGRRNPPRSQRVMAILDSVMDTMPEDSYLKLANELKLCYDKERVQADLLIKLSQKNYSIHHGFCKLQQENSRLVDDFQHLMQVTNRLKDELWDYREYCDADGRFEAAYHSKMAHPHILKARLVREIQEKVAWTPDVEFCRSSVVFRTHTRATQTLARQRTQEPRNSAQ